MRLFGVREKGKVMDGESGKAARGSGTRIVYNTLRDEILSMALAPGSPLDEVGLSERFGLSRTPVREALLRLGAEGLVTTLPNRNTIVSVIDFATLPTYFEALSLMYRVTTRGAASRAGSASLAAVKAEQAAFRKAVEARDAQAMIEANRNFHVAIAEVAGNAYFTTFFARLLDEGRRILRLYYATFEDRLPRKYVEEHEEMIAAIGAGDVDLADRLATAHAAQIVRQIQEFVARDAERASAITLAEPGKRA
jgi:DNA-binding GntR family transcriptional regulator